MLLINVILTEKAKPKAVHSSMHPALPGFAWSEDNAALHDIVLPFFFYHSKTGKRMQGFWGILEMIFGGIVNFLFHSGKPLEKTGIMLYNAGKGGAGMKGREHKRAGNAILRVVFVGVSLVFQVGWLLLLILRLNEYSAAISLISSVLSLLLVLHLYSKQTNAAMKMPWIMLIMAFPVMGLSLFLLTEVLGDLGSRGKRLRAVREGLAKELPRQEAVLARLQEVAPGVAGQCRYLENQGWPAYENTNVTYYAEAAEGFEALKEGLRRAERFIFMEYFIVEDGSAFREIGEVLIEKARQGVEVRLMYDDIGSVGYVNLRFAKGLNDAGIRCIPFNPALPVLNLFMNHRDHRKITVIDGKVGFTGGFNLADEYFGRTRPYGHWKDTGLRLEGEAVASLTAAFLELWNVSSHSREDGKEYLEAAAKVEARGIVQPFGDDPLGEERMAENVFLNLASHAKKTLYFLTPYLIITDELSRALGLAAKRGVDVRIITPGIPDKKTVYAVTRSYYAGLVRQGVRIFEYTPGFCHGKQCVCDGEVAVIGTSNLDYRSLYHHFENNVLLYGCQAVEDMARDFQELFPQCREVSEHYRRGRGAVLRTWQCILRLFAPLM